MIRLTGLIELDDKEPRALAYESGGGKTIIGRDNSADLQIPLTTVSRRHACIEESEGIFTIEDLRSSHGTILNGRGLSPGEKRVLRDGDVIEFTKVRITCHIDGELSVAADPGGTRAVAEQAVKGIFASGGDCAHFRVLTGVAEGERLALVDSLTEWVVGRSKECELVIREQNVSREHAKITRDWRGYTIHELGSKNGVLVNDELVAGSLLLRNKDEVTLGPARLVFIDPDAALTEGLHLPGYEVLRPQHRPTAPVRNETALAAEGDAGENDAGENGAGDIGTDDNPDEADDDSPSPADDGEPVVAPADAGEDLLGAIDGELLEEVKPAPRFQWVVIGVFALFLVTLAAFIFLILL